MKDDIQDAEFAQQKKVHDFIDNTLLEPEYIRDPNNFIIELIDEQHIDFPKNVITTNNCANGLNTDFRFSSSIFHFINKSNDEVGTSALRSFAESSPNQELSDSHHIDTFQDKNTQNFITLNDSFMNSNTLVLNNDLVEDVPQFSLQKTHEDDVIHNDDLPPSNARKILPHKKRISRKLKIAQIDSDIPFLTTKEHKSSIETLDSDHMQFSCEICCFSTSSQIDFFSHLKQHYEPPASILTSMKFTLNSLNSQNNKMCEIKNKIENKQIIFSEAPLPFSDFGNDKIQDCPSFQSLESNDKNLNQVNLEKQINEYENQENYTLKCLDDNQAEFSDPEDMLEEDFRNVVTRVSIEETCDNINLIDNRNSRSPWFSDNFGGIDFKNKPFDDVTLSGHLDNILDVGDGSIIEEPTIDTQDINKSTEFLNFDEFSNDSDIKLKSTKLYICTKCNRRFNSSNALKYHFRTHTGIRPHQCNQCEKSFFTDSALKSHVYIHTGDKPFDCDKCERKFRQWGDLKFHIISKHTNEKSHQCEFCGKAFSRKYSLVIHRRIHTNSRNYKCEFCDKSFRASSYLQNHRKIHTGEKPYECDLCNKRFRVCGDMKRHKKIHQRVNK